MLPAALLFFFSLFSSQGTPLRGALSVLIPRFPESFLRVSLLSAFFLPLLPFRGLSSNVSITLKRVLPGAAVVGSSGLEPPTSRLSGVRSNHLSYAPMFLGLFTCYPHNPFPGSCGGDEEDRTPDPLRARQMLSQLSYTPIPLDSQNYTASRRLRSRPRFLKLCLP